MELRDSRRLTGPNLLWSRPGAVIDVALDDEEPGRVVEMWRSRAREILDAVGWTEEGTAVRAFDGGLSLALSAPLDALYAATEVNERAFAAMEAELRGDAVPDVATVAKELRATIAEESNPPLLALRTEALRQGVAFLSDDDQVSVGMGAGSLTWSVREIPDPGDVDWASIHDVPVALVTGTNGKTTTVRLLSSIADAAGLTPGVTSTDWVRVGNHVLDAGDWSGPGGARRLLRDQRVDVAFLETARGGMMRRGLALERADASCVLNVAADHLGEWGVGDIETLGRGKFVVSSIANAVVLNADDPVVRDLGSRLEQEVVWFTTQAISPIVRAHLESGGKAACFDGESLRLQRGDETFARVDVSKVPVCLGGAARYNVSNALAAMAIANELGIGAAQIREGLESFESDPGENPGRLNTFRFGGMTAIVDFAHNPHGLEAIYETAGEMAPKRWCVLLGQAGDRDDSSIHELVRLTWEARPDRIFIKEMVRYLRGRELGVVPAMIERNLRERGATEEHFRHAESEMAAARLALEWGRDGDVLLLLSHESRDELLGLMQQLETEGWTPGSPLPTPKG